MENRTKRIKKTDINYNGDSPFPKRFTELLVTYNTTQNAIAEEIGVTRQSISQWAKGDTKPDIYYLVKIAEYFEVSADYLLGISDFQNYKDAEKTINQEVYKLVEEYKAKIQNAVKQIY